mmetsp:Transcript_13477/g.33052  ORF Transcript_13477/g.33052 Transcript_13477/m.33052 type:complete len:378 (-) Transcript_13477:93-1226(-)
MAAQARGLPPDPSSPQLSPIGFGCWQLGSKGKDDYWGLKFTDDLAKSLVALAVQKGITYFDTAEAYSKGDSEIQLSVALEALQPEDKKRVVVGSKILPNNMSDCRKSLEATLKRLKAKYVDLYMVHWPITKGSMAHFVEDKKSTTGGINYGKTNLDDVKDVPPVTRGFKQLMKLQEEGLIKHIGVSNFGVKQLEEALKTGVKLAVNQVAYNLLFRAVEYEVLPFCRKNQIQVICYSPLMQGLLVGRYDRVDQIPEYRKRTRHFDSRTNDKSRHGEKGCEELLFKTLDNIREVAKASGFSMAELALAWPLAQPGVTCVIAGATKASHVESNAAAGKIKLPANVAQALRQGTDELKEFLGLNIDMYQGVVDGVQTSRCC